MAENFLLEEDKEFRRHYKISLWWVEHREQLRKLGLAFGVAIGGLLTVFGLWTFTDSFLIGGEAERVDVARMAIVGRELNAYSLATAAKDLETSVITVLPSSTGKFDFATTLTNPNTDWWATFTYTFQVGDINTPVEHGYILPDEEKPLLALAAPFASAPSNAEGQISNLVWHRVDKRVTGPYEAFAKDRLAIEITNRLFSTDVQLDGKPLGRVSFTAENHTAFSYYDLTLTIILRRGTSIVGVNRTTLSSLEAGQNQEVAVNWFGPLPSASEVQVIPEVNIFDLSSYKPLAGETSEDVRTRVFER